MLKRTCDECDRAEESAPQLRLLSNDSGCLIPVARYFLAFDEEAVSAVFKEVLIASRWLGLSGNACKRRRVEGGAGVRDAVDSVRETPTHIGGVSGKTG